MWNTILNPENGFFRLLARLVDIVGLSLLWLVCCLPVVTIGPATGALYLSALRCVRQGESGTYGRFFRSLRENLRVGVLSTLVCLPFALCFLLGFPWLVAMAAGGDRVAAVCYYLWRVLAVALGAAPCVIFPMLARFRLSFRELWAKGLALTLLHLPTGLLLALVVHFAASLSLRWLVPLLFAPALAALLSSLFLERLFSA